MSKYEDFSQSQVSEMIQAALNNTQVNWILSDSDVYEFFAKLIDSHGANVEEGLLKSIKQELAKYKPKDKEDIEVF